MELMLQSITDLHIKLMRNMQLALEIISAYGTTDEHKAEHMKHDLGRKGDATFRRKKGRGHELPNPSIEIVRVISTCSAHALGLVVLATGDPGMKTVLVNGFHDLTLQMSSSTDRTVVASCAAMMEQYAYSAYASPEGGVLASLHSSLQCLRSLMAHTQPLMVRIAAVSALCGLARASAVRFTRTLLHTLHTVVLTHTLYAHTILAFCRPVIRITSKVRVMQVMVHAGMVENLLEGLSNVHKLDAELRGREDLNRKLRDQMQSSNNPTYSQRLKEMEASMEHEHEQRMLLQELMVGCLMRLTTYVDETGHSLDRSLLKVLLVLFQGQTQARLLSLATICVFHLAQQAENAAMLIELGAIKVIVRWIAASKPLQVVRQAKSSGGKQKKGKGGRGAPKKKGAKPIDRDALLMHNGDEQASVTSVGPQQREKLHVYLLGTLWLLLGQARPGSDAHHRLSKAGGLHVMLDVLAHGEPVAQELAVQVLWTSTNRSLANRAVVLLEGVIQLLLMVIRAQRMGPDGNVVEDDGASLGDGGERRVPRRWQLPLIACQYMHCLMQDQDAWQHRFAGPRLAEADKASVVEAALLELFAQVSLHCTIHSCTIHSYTIHSYTIHSYTIHSHPTHPVLIQDEPEICEYAGTALATVTMDDFKKEVLVQLQGIKTLVSVLVRYHGTATQAEGKFYKSAVKAAHVLMNISCAPKFRKVVAKQVSSTLTRSYTMHSHYTPYTRHAGFAGRPLSIEAAEALGAAAIRAKDFRKPPGTPAE
jgi:hypothetical protein